MPELIENELRIERDCSLRIVTNLSSRADNKFVAEREAKERILQRVIEIKRGGKTLYKTHWQFRRIPDMRRSQATETRVGKARKTRAESLSAVGEM